MTEPTAADIEREYPGWRVTRGVDGLMWAAVPGTRQLVRGEDLRDLRDELRRYTSQHAPQ